MMTPTPRMRVLMKKEKQKGQETLMVETTKMEKRNDEKDKKEEDKNNWKDLKSCKPTVGTFKNDVI